MFILLGMQRGLCLSTAHLGVHSEAGVEQYFLPNPAVLSALPQKTQASPDESAILSVMGYPPTSVEDSPGVEHHVLRWGSKYFLATPAQRRSVLKLGVPKPARLALDELKYSAQN